MLLRRLSLAVSRPVVVESRHHELEADFGIDSKFLLGEVE